MRKRKVYIATVGSSKEPILRGILHSSPDIAYLLYGSSPKLGERNPERVARRVRDAAKEFGLTKCDLREIDAFSLESVITEFIRIWQKHMDDNITANMTGGTNIMASACLLAGFTASAEVIYVKELEEGEEASLDEQVIVLPTPRIPLTQVGDQQKAVLLQLLDATEKHELVMWRATSRIAEHLRIAPTTASYHLAKLKKDGLVTIEKQGRETGVKLSPSGLLYARMLETPRR